MYYENFERNIVNVNGREFWVDDPDSFYEMCEFIGISKQDADSYTAPANRPLTPEERSKVEDGMFGDDFYSFLETLGNEACDLEFLADDLEGLSCKGNTRADIAHKLRNIVENIRDLI